TRAWRGALASRAGLAYRAQNLGAHAENGLAGFIAAWALPDFLAGSDSRSRRGQRDRRTGQARRLRRTGGLRQRRAARLSARDGRDEENSGGLESDAA